MPDLRTEFKPCVTEYDDGGYTELTLRDCVTIWKAAPSGTLVDLGYDEDGNLVSVRIDGRVANQK